MFSRMVVMILPTLWSITSATSNIPPFCTLGPHPIPAFEDMIRGSIGGRTAVQIDARQLVYYRQYMQQHKTGNWHGCADHDCNARKLLSNAILDVRLNPGVQEGSRR